MADTSRAFLQSVSKKRSRDEDDDNDDYSSNGVAGSQRGDKRVRPASNDSSVSDPWARARDSVVSTPRSMMNVDLRKMQPPLYDDSDDQESLMSESVASKDVAMFTVDEEMNEDESWPQHTQDALPRSPVPQIPWQRRQPGTQQTNRVPTPMLPLSSPSRPGVRPIQLRTSLGQHVRHRHPQENFSNSSDLLEVPSPIDEDEVSTPPSAAEAAGSQLSMLSVNDMDIEAAESLLPTIAINPAHSCPFGAHTDHIESRGLAIDENDSEPMQAQNHLASMLFVRKQRARSGALSAGHGSSSPISAELGRAERDETPRRVVSIGYRADCQKCLARVPGHMNHFT